MNIVYRVEHETISVYKNKNIGQGCYVNRPIEADWYERMREEHANSYIHPNIWVDGMECFTDRENGDIYYCCFSSIELLETWFEGYLDLLAEEGFIVVEYTLNEEAKEGYSRKQSMFSENVIISKRNLTKSLVF